MVVRWETLLSSKTDRWTKYSCWPGLRLLLPHTTSWAESHSDSAVRSCFALPDTVLKSGHYYRGCRHSDLLGVVVVFVVLHFVFPWNGGTPRQWPARPSREGPVDSARFCGTWYGRLSEFGRERPSLPKLSQVPSHPS